MLGLADTARSAGHEVLVVSEAKGCETAAKLGFETARAPEPDFVTDVEAYQRRVATFAQLDFAERVSGIQSMFRERASWWCATRRRASVSTRSRRLPSAARSYRVRCSRTVGADG